MRDLEVIEYFFELMEVAAGKLDKAVNTNNLDDAEKLKKVILDISNNISEELG
jgi:hypothetical protein